MSLREERLATRLGMLVHRSNALREVITEDFEVLAAPLGCADRAYAAAPRLMRFLPLVVGAGVAVLAWKRPRGLGSKLIAAWHYTRPLRPWLISLLAQTRQHQAPPARRADTQR